MRAIARLVDLAHTGDFGAVAVPSLFQTEWIPGQNFLREAGTCRALPRRRLGWIRQTALPAEKPKRSPADFSESWRGMRIRGSERLSNLPRREAGADKVMEKIFPDIANGDGGFI